MASSEEVGEERAERLAAKYRARRTRPVDPDEVDRFSERVFGTDEGYEVLIDYLYGDSEVGGDGLPADGRPIDTARAR